MLTPAGIDDVSEKWKIMTVREKSLAITAFLNKYGEHATWEEWCSFLQENETKCFEWTQSLD
jgi:hypothetical protein